MLLVSLKAGGVGLNLTAASRVHLLDPWWNPSVEEQAMDRVHRLGQTRAVHIYRQAAAGHGPQLAGRLAGWLAGWMLRAGSAGSFDLPMAALAAAPLAGTRCRTASRSACW